MAKTVNTWPNVVTRRFITTKSLNDLNTVACNYLFTHVTKTCSAGQSTFRVLTIKLQSLRAHFGTFWRYSTNTYVKGRKVGNAYGHFVFFENQNEWWKINGWISVGYRGSARALAEEDLHFLSESTLKATKDRSQTWSPVFRLSQDKRRSFRAWKYWE